MNFLTFLGLALAALPATLFLLNLAAYRRPRAPRVPATASGSPAAPDTARTGTPGVSVLIPARNEQDAIGPALEAILADPLPSLEVLVLDDHSTDRTAEVVTTLAARDPRVRLVTGATLPSGWCGKQHACWQLAHAARHDLLLFLDADVRVSPGAVSQLARHLADRPHLHLVSGVPRQITGTFLEKLLIPLIHFVLLGYLPLPAARLFRWSAFAAGCGQLFMARRPAYFASGGHQAIRASLHDGVKLPRAFRVAGFTTDLVDVTGLAQCRMYRSASEVWRGLGKNATEGLGHPAAILPWTFLLLGGQVLPWILLAAGGSTNPLLFRLNLLAAGLTLLPRLLGAAAFRQSWLGALLHPLGILALVAIQWQALARQRLGRPMEWRGRAYHHPTGAPTGNAIP